MNGRNRYTRPIGRPDGSTAPTRSTARLYLAAMMIAAATMFVGGARVEAQLECSRTYTVDADFDEGLLQNVNHDAPNGDQLQLNERATPPPFLWVANSARGTVARIDVNTGAVIGEYKTSPDQRLRDPSRTTVDLSGNVWVGNRAETGTIGGVPHGSVVKIGVVLGGTRTDASGTPDANGQYLKPPFSYSTAVDRDGDGLIRTSRALGNILAWTDPADPTVGDVADAQDECIIIYKRVPNAVSVRHVSIDASNDVWVGGYPFALQAFHKLDGDDGSIITTVSAASRGCGGYGGLVDGNGMVWSASLIEGKLMRYDPVAASTICVNVPNSYGLAIDNSGFLWNSLWTSNAIAKIDPSGSMVAGYPKTWAGASQCRGVAVTADNNIWVANSGAGTVSRLDNNAILIANIPVGNQPTGVAVDANGSVWVANLGSNNAVRIDPSTNTVDMTVNLGAGAGPYNYSDMTGRVAITATSQQGTWTTVLNSGAAGTDWGKISWNGSTPSGTAIDVEVRAAASQAALTGESFVAATNGSSFCGTGVTGQYLEIRTTLSRDPGITETPILYDLTAELCDETGPVPDVATLPTLNGECSVSVPTPTATDNCDGPVNGTTTDPLIYSAQGNYTVNWTYTDAKGNSTIQTQSVVVDDVTSPVPDLAVLPTITGECSAEIASAPTATDNCSGPLTATTSDPLSYSTQGSHTVTWTYDDGNGNTISQNQTVVVDDVTDPVITVAASTSLWTPNHSYHTFGVAGMVASISDNCSSSLAVSDVRISSVTSDELEDAPGGGDGNTTNDIVIAGDCQSVDVRAERLGSGNGRVYRIYLTLDDGNGNETTTSYVVNVPKSSSHPVVEDAALYTVNSACPAAKYVPVATYAVAGHSLMPNIPNPFSITTSIDYTLGQSGHVTLAVYDINSTLVATLVDAEQGAGDHTAVFDGSTLRSGTYIYRLQINGSVMTGRMILLR